jgi:glyoxylase-like metal-dependent hydrolase (beta-lactamase superfamily II)
LVCSQTGHAVLIDPGDEAVRLMREIGNVRINDKPIELRFLLHTHAHFDHIGATSEVAARCCEAKTASIALHPADRPLYEALPEQGQLFGFRFDKPTPIQQDLEHGQVLAFGNAQLHILHTPGHSPGSVSFLLNDGTKKTVYTGDTLFKESVGRSDLWGGDHVTLMHSIRKKLLTLDESTRVAAGHGPDSSILYELKNNPFVQTT